MCRNEKLSPGSWKTDLSFGLQYSNLLPLDIPSDKEKISYHLDLDTL